MELGGMNLQAFITANQQQNARHRWEPNSRKRENRATGGKGSPTIVATTTVRWFLPRLGRGGLWAGQLRFPLPLRFGASPWTKGLALDHPYWVILGLLQLSSLIFKASNSSFLPLLGSIYVNRKSKIPNKPKQASQEKQGCKHKIKHINPQE